MIPGLQDFAWQEGHTLPSELDEIERLLSVRLPEDYVSVAAEHGGGSGWVGPAAYLVLWPLVELPARNEALAVKSIAPNFTAFGSDGAGGLFGIVVEQERAWYAEVPAIGFARDQMVLVGESFPEFIATLAERRDGAT